MCLFVGFPGGLAGEESARSTGDPSLILGLGSSPGEGIGYPLLYVWTRLVAQMIKKMPEMQETWVRSLGWEDPLKESMATHSSILAWRIPMDRSLAGTVHGVTESDTTEQLSTVHVYLWTLGQSLYPLSTFIHVSLKL